MKVDISKIDNNSVLKTDICVVGAGPAGIAFAREFIGTSVQVAIIESGSFNYDKDDTVQKLNEGINEPVNVEVENGIPEYDLSKIRARAFGGTSHLWNVSLPEGVEGIRLRGLDEIDFEERDWVPYSGWPFGKKDLASYYSRAHKVLKIGPYSYDTEFWMDKDEKADLDFEKGEFETTFFQFARKDIFYKDYRTELEKAKNIDIYLHSTALKVQLNKGANSTKCVLVAKPNGDTFSVRAKQFVLALGGLETPRLMLLSDDIMSSGVGNQNGLVGRFFMEHPHIRSGVYYPSNLDQFEKSTVLTIHRRKDKIVQAKVTLSEKKIKEEKLLNFVTFLRQKPMIELESSERAIRDLPRSIKEWDSLAVKKNFRQIFNNINLISYILSRKIFRGGKKKWYDKKYKYHGFELEFMMEQIPDPDSRVILDDTSLDHFGQKKLKLNWKINKEDLMHLKRIQELIDEELRKNKLGKLESGIVDNSIPEKIHGGKHHMGTTRMNADPKYGVVDSNCKVHGIDNLFVTGSSVFPTGGFANPTLTIIALALRLSDHMKEKKLAGKVYHEMQS